MEALAGVLGSEGRRGGLVEGEKGFKLGAGEGEFDAADEGGELEAFGLAGRGREQAAQAAAKVGRAVEVGLGAVVLAEEREDGGFGGNVIPAGVLGIEWGRVLEHRGSCSRVARCWPHGRTVLRTQRLCLHLFQWVTREFFGWGRF